MIRRLLMKVDDSTLQNILKAYGKQIKPRQNKLAPQKPHNETKTEVSEKLDTEELDIINYDKEGNVSINPKKKDALIDFFQ